MMQAVEKLPPGHYRVRHVVKSETLKILSLRSTAVTLGVTVVAALLVTGLVANAALGHQLGYYVGFDPTQQSLTGMIVAGLTGGVFGALLITGEYASGTIRTTLSATPRRQVVLTAKLAVTAVSLIVFSEILSVVSFFLGQAILSGQSAPTLNQLSNSGQVPLGPGGRMLISHVLTHASLTSPGALRAVVFTGLFIALLGLMAFGFGLAFRSTAGAIAAFVGVVFVLPLVMRGISEHAVRYVPTNMLVSSVMSTVRLPGGGNLPVSPGLALLLMVIYAVTVVAAGCVVFVRRDA
jgi:ABC-type transport system involved in multi-copper enzyme maturation permease subunit